MELIFFILTYFLLTISILGFGFLFAKKITSYNSNINIGYIGLYGIFLLTLISYITNLVIKHDYLHNIILLIIGIFFFVQYVFSDKYFKKNKDLKYLIFFLILSILAILYYKSHDDFPYYHLSFTHNLTLNKLEFGLGNFDLAFNHVSSLFFFHSLFRLPFTQDYFYFLGPALIMVFANTILIKSIYENKKKLNFHFFLKFFIFVFINVFFYRLAEHGTDRSAIILIFLSILIIFEILDNSKLKNQAFENLIILLTMIISLKSFYAIYSLLFFLIYFKYFKISDISLFYKNFKVVNFSIIFAILILFYNIAYTGCFIYPLSFTCYEKFYWGLDISRVQEAAQWYELWSKAGATPNYRVENPESYIKGLNWLSVWIENYFFNKITDTTAGLIATILIFLFIFKPNKNIFTINYNYKYVFVLLFIFFIEWFLFHPSLRYGGFHLLALIFFIPAAIFLSNQNYNYSKNLKKVKIILIIGIALFSFRNIDRIINENEIYSYNPLKSPYYKIQAKDYLLEQRKRFIIKNTNQCKDEFKKNQNCKIVNSYRIFY